MTAENRTLLPLGLANVPASLRRILAQEGVPTCDFDRPTSATFVLFDSAGRRVPLLYPDQVGIDVDAIRRQFAEDPFARLDELTTSRSVWRVGEWEAGEETAQVDKRAIRAAVIDQLRRQVESLGGVWLRAAPFPHPYHSAFNFRFDHDAFDAADFDAVVEAIAGHEGATTHFVCAAPHEAHASALARLADCDVGSHGYRHHTYRTRRENVVNIARGIETLERLGLRPTGFAAPHARYHDELAAALHELHIPYSSEFAVAYDDWPGLPPGSPVLQMPIHPVCLGIVLEAAERASPGDATARDRVADAVLEHFLSVAAAKRAAREPICLYGHPDGRLGRYPHIVRKLLNVVDRWPDVWRTTLSEFAQWWKYRAAIGLTVHETADGYELQTIAVPPGYCAAVEWFRGESSTFVPLDRPLVTLSPRHTKFAPLPKINLLQPVRRETIGGVKELILRALDWEYATPIDEIDGRTWRGRIKRSLRHWKATAA